MANRKIKESFAKTKFSTTLKNICGDKVIATADTIADLNYNATLADGTVTEGAYQSEVNKLHADAIEELKKSRANVAFNNKDIAYDEAMKVFEFADNIDTSNYSTIILRGVLDAEGKETDVLDCTPITMENCTYIVKRTFTLTQDLVLPKNSCLCFEGGFIRADESHWITSVLVQFSSILENYFIGSFTIQNNTGHPIIGENVLLDVPYNSTFKVSWFVNATAFFKNAVAVTQLQRDNMILGIHLYLDDSKILYNIENESFTFDPINRNHESPFIIQISSVASIFSIVRGDFVFSPYDEDTGDYNSVALLLINVQMLNVTKTHSLIVAMYLKDALYYGLTKVVYMVLQASEVELESDILPDVCVNVEAKMSQIKTDYPILVKDSYCSCFESDFISSRLSHIENHAFTGCFEPTSDCIISNCIFDKLDTDRYYSDDAEANGIYFYNCMLNNIPLNSYTRFKVIE